MNTTKGAMVLALLTAVVSMVAAAVGLFWTDDGQSWMFTTLHGETVEIYGQGLYRNDTFFKGPLLRGTDAVTLFMAVPLLLAALNMARSGSLRGRLLLAGVMSYFAYYATSLALGVSYNDLYLLYLIYFPLAIFGFVLACLSIDVGELGARLLPGLPRRLMAGFLVVAGLSVFVWLIPIVEGISAGEVPHGLDMYTTEATFYLDLGLIAPVAFLAAWLVFKARPAGYLLAGVVLTLNAMIGVVVIGQTIAQNLAGVEITTGEMVTFVGLFVVTSVIAASLVWSLLRHIDERGVAAGAAPGHK